MNQNINIYKNIQKIEEHMIIIKYIKSPKNYKS